MSLRRHKYSSIAFILAVAIYSAAWFYYQRYDWTPLEIPIAALGEKTSGKFRAQRADEYGVLVEFDQAADPEFWACVYGAKVFAGTCKDDIPDAVVRWSVADPQATIATGVASGADRWAGSAESVMRSKITTLDAERGVDYTISVSLSGPHDLLEQTRPRVIIELSPSLHKDVFVKASLMSMLGHVFFIIAITALSFELFFGWRSKRPPRQ